MKKLENKNEHHNTYVGKIMVWRDLQDLNVCSAIFDRDVGKTRVFMPLFAVSYIHVSRGKFKDEEYYIQR